MDEDCISMRNEPIEALDTTAFDDMQFGLDFAENVEMRPKKTITSLYESRQYVKADN